MSEPPEWTLFNVVEQLLQSELSLDEEAPHLISSDLTTLKKPKVHQSTTKKMHK